MNVKSSKINFEKERLMYDLLCHGLLWLYSKEAKTLQTNCHRNQELAKYFKRRLKDNRYKKLKADIRQLLSACRSDKIDMEKLLNNLVNSAKKTSSLVKVTNSESSISDV